MNKRLERMIRTLRTEAGAPFYLFDLDMLRENIRRLRGEIGPGRGLCFAMKCNPFLAEDMSSLADRLEVCSFGEYRICKACGIPPKKLLISGVLKKPEELRKILEENGGRCRYTVESPAQYRQLADWASRSHEILLLYPRLTSGNQFGMDRQELQEICRKSRGNPFVRIQGLHYYSGTQKRKPEKAAAELQELDGFLAELQEEEGIFIPELEFGPGMAVSYFQGQEDCSGKFLRELCRAADSMRWKGQLTLEMGRAAAASCGFYVTEVCDLKKNAGRQFCITDGGIHQMHYDGQIRGMYHPVVSVLPGRRTAAGTGGGDAAGENDLWTVCGSLCTVNDVISADMKLGNLQVGDLLVFENTGAYSMVEGMALFLSHELPGIAVCSSGEYGKWLRRPSDSWKLNCGMEQAENMFRAVFPPPVQKRIGEPYQAGL